jgi:hypothetical protein
MSSSSQGSRLKPVGGGPGFAGAVPAFRAARQSALSRSLFSS